MKNNYFNSYELYLFKKKSFSYQQNNAASRKKKIYLSCNFEHECLFHFYNLYGIDLFKIPFMIFGYGKFFILFFIKFLKN